MTDKQKIADLEKRVKDLEARPQAPTIIVLPVNPLPSLPVYPIFPQPWNPWTNPFIPYGPTWISESPNVSVGGVLECPSVTMAMSLIR